MPQKFGLYEDLTVMEKPDLYADPRSHGEARKKIFDRLLEFTSLVHSPNGWQASFPAG